MEGLFTRGWGHIFLGVALAPRTPANQRLAIRVGDSTSGIDPEHHRFRPRIVEVVDV